MSSFLACCGSLLLVTMATLEAGMEETCAELEFTGFRHGETVKVLENSFADVTFRLKTSKCTHHNPQWLRLKVSYHYGNFNVDVCSMIFNLHPANCEITDKSAFCRCIDAAGLSARLYKQFNHSGNTSYTWSWSDSTSGQTQKKAQIMFDVTNHRGGERVSASGTTSPEADDKKGEAVNFQAFLINSVVTACVIAIPIVVIGLCVYVYRRKRASVTRPTDGDQSQELETSTEQRPFAGQVRRCPQRDEAEYTEISDDADPPGSSSAKVHENYEHPVQDKGEDQSDYSQLQYKFMWRLGRCQGKDGRKKQEKDSSGTEIEKVSRTAGTAPTTDLAEDYLEPVPSSTDAST